MTEEEAGSFYEALAAALGRDPDRKRLAAGARSLSGAELLAEVELWAALLHGLGVGKGDRVAVQAEKSLELVLLYLATQRLGALILPLNSGYQLSEIDYFLTDAEAALFVCDPADLEAYRDLLAGRKVEVRSLGADGKGTLREALGEGPGKGRAPIPPIAPEDLAAIVYTSGTTGRSKGAMVTHRNLVSNAAALIEAWGIDEKDILLHALPLFHIHGLFIALNSVLLAGGRVELLPKFDAKEVVERLKDVTLFMGVPTHYTRLLAEPGLDAKIAAAMRLFVCGSAPLTIATFEQFEQRTGHKILERYGMSECGIICSNPLVGERVPGAVGKKLPGVEVRIAEDAEIGVLEVRGPNVCAGYWRQPEKTREEFRTDGFFVTGDIATIDEAGVVRIVGRDKDMIISGGLNIYPKEIEALIDDFPEVEECAVIGLPHPDFGEGVAAVVRLAGGAALAADKVAERLRPKLAAFKLPKAVFFVDELPRNAMGKVQKAMLRDSYKEAFAPAGEGADPALSL